VSYAAPQDLLNRYPNRDLVQLTNEDPAAQVVDTAVLQQALDDASAEIDGYLGARFALPLSDPPTVLNRLTADIAVYRLQALRPLHDLADARRRYDDAVAMLGRVAAGELTLGIASDQRETQIADSAEQAEGPARVFSRRSLKGF
jgi:phage gp36-like protein